MSDEVPLYERSASELLSDLREGRVRSVDIVDALDERRKALDPKLNAFTQVFSDAREKAQEADRRRDEGMSVPPLLGLPITIKENLDLAGTDATLGLSERQGRPASKDAVLVREFLRQGVVLLGKTNVPQALLAQETENQLFGRTNNPWSLDHSPGGSSGGEAAAVASGMSPMGIGTDIGGSIRMPAHFCGIVGFKPTLDRWSNRGSNTAIAGQELVRAQAGLLCRSCDDLELAWQSIDPQLMAKGDPRVSPRAPLPLPKLDGMTIGFVDGDDFLQPADCVKRALSRAREVCEAAGAKLVRHWPVPSHNVLSTWLGGLTADGARTLKASLGNDEFSEQLKPSVQLLKVPEPVRRAMRPLLAALGERRVSLLLSVVGEKTVTQWWELTQRRTDMRNEEFDAWQRQELDAVICAPHVVPAMPHGMSGDFVLSLAAEFRWTLLDFPAGVVPVTRVKESETQGYSRGDRVEKRASEILKAGLGLPLGVQVVAQPGRDEAAIAVMKAIEAGVKGDDGFPSTPVGPRPR